jgi:hypothetical protein
MKTKTMPILLAVMGFLLSRMTIMTASAESSLSLSRPMNFPTSVGNAVATTSGSTLTMLGFSLTASGGPATPWGIWFVCLSGSAMPNRLQLFRNPGQSGELLISEITLTSVPSIPSVGVEFFMPISQTQRLAINSGATAVYALKARYTTPAPNAPAYGMVALTGVDYKTDKGTAMHLNLPSPMIGNELHLYPVAATWTQVQPATVDIDRSIVTFYNRVAVDAGMIETPKQFAVLGCIGRDTFMCQVIDISVSPYMDTVPAGSTVRIYVTAKIPDEILQEAPFARSGLVTFRLAQINWAQMGGTAVEQTWGLETWKTDAPALLTSSKPMVGSWAMPIGYKLWEKIPALQAPNLYGFAGQVVSEGGAIHIRQMNANNIRRVVFPADGPNRASMLQVDANVTPDDIVPHIFAPTDPSSDDYDSFVEKVVSNVRHQKVDDEGQIIGTTFDVTVGGLVMHGKMCRTGNYSCIVTMHWGEGSAAGYPGEFEDILDLSGSLPPMAPATGPAHPRRFEFGMTDYSMVPFGPSGTGGYANISVNSLHAATLIQGSTDLKNWFAVPAAIDPSSLKPMPSKDGIAPSGLSMSMTYKVRLAELPEGLKDRESVFFRSALY